DMPQQHARIGGERRALERDLDLAEVLQQPVLELAALRREAERAGDEKIEVVAAVANEADVEVRHRQREARGVADDRLAFLVQLDLPRLQDDLAVLKSES